MQELFLTCTRCAPLGDPPLLCGEKVSRKLEVLGGTAKATCIPTGSKTRPGNTQQFP